MLATALFSRGTGSNGSPEHKTSARQACVCVHVHLHQPLCLSMASCRWQHSSQMLYSMEPLARPKERKVAMAKRRCLLQTWPLLKKRPADTWRNGETQAWSVAQQPCCVFGSFTWISRVNSGRHRAVRPVHKAVSLCHDGLLHHLPPRHKHCLVSSQTDAENTPVNISQLWTQEQETKALLSSMWLWEDKHFGIFAVLQQQLFGFVCHYIHFHGVWLFFSF